MARASVTIDLSEIEKMAKRFEDPALKTQLNNVVANEGITALVIQAIADNFRQEGPGWQPLKAATIRASVAKKLRKQLRSLSDEQVLRYEVLARMKHSEENPNRQILRRTSLLFNTVTKAGYSGSSVNNQRALDDAARSQRKRPQKGQSVQGQNIRQVQGTNLIWGTNLIYAGVQNYGRGAIPAREFLVIRPEWEKRLHAYAFSEMERIVNLFMEGKS